MQLFVLSNTGRPSMGWNLGLGGAVPQPTYAPPALPPPFADGVYGITNDGRHSCNNYLTALECNVSNSVQIGSSGEPRQRHAGVLKCYLLATCMLTSGTSTKARRMHSKADLVKRSSKILKSSVVQLYGS